MNHQSNLNQKIFHNTSYRSRPIQAIVVGHTCIERQHAESINAVKHECNITQSLALHASRSFCVGASRPRIQRSFKTVQNSVFIRYLGSTSAHQAQRDPSLGSTSANPSEVNTVQNSDSWAHVGQPSTQRLCFLGARRQSKHRETESASNDEPRCSQESSCLAPI